MPYHDTTYPANLPDGLRNAFPAECRVVCPTCKQDVRFFPDLLFGRTLESCACGTRLMQPHVEQPIEIPPALPGEQEPKVIWRSQVCPECHKTFPVAKGVKRVACSSLCAKEWQKKSGMVDKPCHECGKALRVRKGTKPWCATCRGRAYWRTYRSKRRRAA